MVQMSTGGGGSATLTIITESGATAALTNAVDVMLCDSATITVNLHSATSATKKLYQIKNINAAAVVTIDPDGAETIDGIATKVLSVQYESISLIPDGSNWVIV